MKKILSLIAVLFLGLSASAQQKAAPVRKAPVHKAQGEGQFEFTYFTGEDFQPMGSGQKETYDCAIWIPGNFAGMKVMDMAFLIYDKNYIDRQKVKGWVSAQLPTTADVSNGALACQTIPTIDVVNWDDTRHDGYCYLKFDGGVTIPEDGCYVGYSLTVTDISTAKGQAPVFLTYEQLDQPGGFWYRTSSSTEMEWIDNYGTENGNLTTVVTIQGVFPTEALSISQRFATINVLTGETCQVPVTITGAGINPVKSFTYKVTDLDGSNPYEKTFTINGTQLSLNEPATTTLTVPASPAKGYTDRRIEITHVNGQANGSTDNVCQGTTLTLNERLPRKVLFEEVTGTNCGWCPRGIVGMERILQQYPDEFIGIAYHFYDNKDPMFNMDYTDMVDYYSSAPSAMLNRTWFDLDPLYGSTYREDFGILKDMERAKNSPAEASVEVKPMWSEDGNDIIVNTSVKFICDNAEAPYRLAYAVVEDGITNKAQEWMQSNYYRSVYDQIAAQNVGALQVTIDQKVMEYLAIDKSSPMWEWTQKAIYIKGMVFDNVCLTGDKLSTGIEGSVAAPVVEGQTQSHHYVIPIVERNTVMKKKANVRVVAILLNTETGAVVNSDSRTVTAYDPSGIEEVELTTATPLQQPLINVAGQRVASNYKGLVIRNGKKIMNK